MEEIILKRSIISNRGILGILSKGDKEIARTLERPWKDNQKDISCIPEGSYKVIRDTTGRFKWWKLVNVAGRGSIEIHEGNRVDDSHGCILIGKNWTFVDNNVAIANSKVTLNALVKILPVEFILKIIS